MLEMVRGASTHPLWQGLECRPTMWVKPTVKHVM